MTSPTTGRTTGPTTGTAAFDHFYVATRDRMLAETYALTGDLSAATSAVRDGYVAAWHHWRSVARTGDPEGWLRPLVHSRAQRRHQARPWHRERDLDPDAVATLEALSRLSSAQRRVLVLTHVSPLPMADIAREAGLTPSRAEHELQAGTAAYAVHRGAPSTAVRAHLDHLGEVSGQGSWPLPGAIRKQGATRRRTHALVGTAAAVAALALSGLVVTGGDAEPTGFATEDAAGRAVALPAADAEPPTLEESRLLTPAQVRRYSPGLRWREAGTDPNLDGNGLVIPCQAERFADPQGLAALVRQFRGTEQAGGQGRQQGRAAAARRQVTRARATEVVELSRNARAARRAFADTRSWYAGCAAPRVQLLDTREVSGVGDEAMLFVLRDWGSGPGGMAIGVARSGRITLTSAVELPPGPVRVEPAVTALAAGVNRLCGSAGSGACASPPRSRSVAPLPTGQAPGMLAALDLPPVSGARGPWVGTEPEVARVNDASTRCDNTSFVGGGLSRGQTRTFLFPANKAADSFGLTQSVARTRTVQQARGFVDEVRSRIAKCGRANLGTEVDTLSSSSGAERDLTLWSLQIELGGDRVLDFWMAIMRRGTAVSQIGFVSESDLRLDLADFRSSVDRAMERLDTLPAARR